MVKQDILREGVEVSIGPQEGPEFQGGPKIGKEFVGVGKGIPKETGDDLAATKDLSNLAKALKTADTESRGGVLETEKPNIKLGKNLENLLNGGSVIGPDGKEIVITVENRDGTVASAVEELMGE